MIATVHMLAGATIYMTLREKNESGLQTALKIGLCGLGSHIILDAIPHIEPSTFGQLVLANNSFVTTFSWIDNIVGAVLMLWLSSKIRQLVSVGAVLSVVAAWAPDAIQLLETKHIWTGIAAQSYLTAHDALHFWRASATLDSWLIGLIATIATTIFLLLQMFKSHACVEHAKAYGQRQFAAT